MLRLICALIIVGSIWLILLPAIARWSPVRQHICTMQSAGIAVDAMFYTELNWLPGH